MEKRSVSIFAEDVKRHFPAMRSFLRAKAIPHHDVDEILQTAWIQAVVKRSTLRGEIFSWFRTIVYRTLLTKIRDDNTITRGGKEKILSINDGEGIEVAAGYSSPIDRAMRNEQYAPLWQAFDRLSEDEQQLLADQFFYPVTLDKTAPFPGYSWRDRARATARAMQKLRSHLQS